MYCHFSQRTAKTLNDLDIKYILYIYIEICYFGLVFFSNNSVFTRERDVNPLCLSDTCHREKQLPVLGS